MAKSKLINCKACGAQISSNAHSCPHCGEENKKPFYKKPWVWILVAVIAVAALGSGGEDTSPSVDETAPPAVVATVPTAAPATEPATIAPTEPAVETAAPTQAPAEADQELSIAELASLIELTAADSYENYRIEYDEDTITFSVWNDGLAEGAVYAAAGNTEVKAAWDDMVTQHVGLCDSMVELAEVCGRDDIYIMVNILNDQNTDNILVSILNGIVIYDVVDSN